ncbi:TPA: hypothetical protein ACOVFI_004746 [Citrobacter braakii]
MPITIDIDLTTQRIHELTQGGFVKLTDIFWIITDEYFDPDELTPEDEVWIDEAVKKALTEKQLLQTAWSGDTSYDKLEYAFEILRGLGYIALHQAGNTISDGKEDVKDIWKAVGGPKSEILGYCFYHSQDVDRAVHTGNLYLAFSGIGATREESIQRSTVLAMKIRETMENMGFQTSWDGNLDNRIDIHFGQWTKRSMY